MKKYLITVFFFSIFFLTNIELFSKEYTEWKCDWKEIKFDNTNFFEVESIIDKSKNDILFFSKRTKYGNLLLSSTSDLGRTWSRDSFLFTGNYTINKKNQLFVYNRPNSRMFIINAWTMWKHDTKVNAPLYIGDSFFEVEDSILVAMPKYSASAKMMNSFLINLKDSSFKRMGPIDSTGEIIEPFRHIRYVYKSNIPNRICFISDQGEYYYSDNYGDSATKFFYDPDTFLNSFPTKNGRFYYSKPGPPFYRYVEFSGTMLKIECLNVFITRLNNEEGDIDTVFHTYTQLSNVISSDVVQLKNNENYVTIGTNNDSLFFSDDYGDNFYYIKFPPFFDSKRIKRFEIATSNRGEIIMKWFDSTAGGQYHGAIGKPYPNPYSVATELIENYKTYRQGDKQIIEFGNSDFLNPISDIELYNIFGQKIENLNFQLLENQLNINTTQLTSGIYILTLENYSKRVALKLLIAN